MDVYRAFLRAQPLLESCCIWHFLHRGVLPLTICLLASIKQLAEVFITFSMSHFDPPPPAAHFIFLWFLLSFFISYKAWKCCTWKNSSSPQQLLCECGRKDDVNRVSFFFFCNSELPPPPLCANTGLSKHGDPVFPHFWSFF